MPMLALNLIFVTCLTIFPTFAMMEGNDNRIDARHGRIFHQLAMMEDNDNFNDARHGEVSWELNLDQVEFVAKSFHLLRIARENGDGRSLEQIMKEFDTAERYFEYTIQKLLKQQQDLLSLARG